MNYVTMIMNFITDNELNNWLISARNSDITSGILLKVIKCLDSLKEADTRGDL